MLAAPPPTEPARLQTAPLLATGYTTTRTITYTYDPLYRLTRADYSDGTYFRYTYDAVGNRLSEETTGGTVNSYTYDAANRLVGVSGAGKTISYTYSGLGDRLRETVNGITTSYTLDTSTSLSAALAAGLTQVLSDGTDTYLYGVGHIAQSGASGAQCSRRKAARTARVRFFKHTTDDASATHPTTGIKGFESVGWGMAASDSP